MDDISLTYKNGVPDAIVIFDRDSRLAGAGLVVDVSGIDADEAKTLRAEFARMTREDLDQMKGQYDSIVRAVGSLPEGARETALQSALKVMIEGHLRDLGVSGTVDGVTVHNGSTSRIERDHVLEDRVDVIPSRLKLEHQGAYIMIGLNGVSLDEAAKLERYLQGQSATDIIGTLEIMMKGGMNAAERTLADGLIKDAMAGAEVTGETTGPSGISFVPRAIR